MTSRIRIALYGEIDMNLVDGSSIWLQSLALVLTRVPEAHLTVLLRTPERRRLLTQPLHDLERCIVVDPAKLMPGVRRLEAPEAADLVQQLDEEHRFDVVIVRGGATADELVRRGSFHGRLWLYHVPRHGRGAEEDASDLRMRAVAAGRILYQTEEIRAHIVRAVPDAAGKLVPLPPMIPLDDDQEGIRDPRPPGPPLLFYAGKFSPEYYFLEMVDLLRRLRRSHPGIELHVAGDKVHNPPEDPAFKPAAEQALTATEGLVWHGALSRDEVRNLARTSDVALSIRHPKMDVSTELSTKILEYGAAGCAVLLNRNAIHERLLGADYPLLVSGIDEAVQRVAQVIDDPEALEDARRRCRTASRVFTFDRVAEALAPHLRVGRRKTAEQNIVVAGHALGFFSEISERLTAAGAAVREDLWRGHAAHDEAQSTELVNWADTIFCEWCLGNAVWYSRHKRPDQRLVVRMHRQEVETEHPSKLELDAVDAMIFVAEHIRDWACDTFGWDRGDARFHVIPNAIDVAHMARPKLPATEFNLGMIGWVNHRKRLDRVLDITERVRARDDRFRLILKGKGPWEYKWMLERSTERRFYEGMFKRIQRAPLLGPAVSFEGFGDVADYLQTVGYVLSVSDSEGHPVGVAEGMASGAAPVIFERPGARDQYPGEWVHSTAEHAAAAILATAEGEGQPAAGARAREYVQQWSWDSVREHWGRVIYGADVPLPPR